MESDNLDKNGSSQFYTIHIATQVSCWQK